MFREIVLVCLGAGEGRKKDRLSGRLLQIVQEALTNSKKISNVSVLVYSLSKITLESNFFKKKNLPREICPPALEGREVAGVEDGV